MIKFHRKLRQSGIQPNSAGQQGITPKTTSTLRITPFVGLALGVTLLAAGLLLTSTAIAQAHKQQRTLQRDAAQVSDAFSSYFERARSLDLLLSHDQAFASTENGAIDRG